MARIRGVETEDAVGYVARLFEAQHRRYGRVLETNLLYGRCPSILKAVRGMWAGLDQSEKLPKTLIYLLNVRVSGLIGCPF